VWILIIAAPPGPLVLAWSRMLERVDFEARSASWIKLVLVTGSFGLLLSGLIWTPILGPYYSQRRFGMIDGSFALMVLVAITSVFGSARLRIPLTMSAIILALEWAYVAVVNSVV